MTFDPAKSKLFDPIMQSAIKFFKLKEDATEAEIHDAMEGKDPLEKQIEDAKEAATSAQAKEFADMKTRLEKVEQTQADLNKQIEQKDERIAELQLENEKNLADFNAAKEQHTKEIKIMAGKLAAHTAGAPKTADESGDKHEADKQDDPKDNEKPVAMASDELKNLVKKKQTPFN